MHKMRGACQCAEAIHYRGVHRLVLRRQRELGGDLQASRDHETAASPASAVNPSDGLQLERRRATTHGVDQHQLSHTIPERRCIFRRDHSAERMADQIDLLESETIKQIVVIQNQI
jgi:hypothetical protein